MQIAIKDRQNPLPLCHFGDGVSMGRDGGSVGWLSFASSKILDRKLLAGDEVASLPVDGQVLEDAEEEEEDGETSTGCFMLEFLWFKNRSSECCCRAL